MTDIASDGTFDDFQAPLDGRSLLAPALPKEEQRVFIESTGETLHAPALIVVEQDRKLAQTGDDSPMMFNLETDPLEQNNIARAGDALEADLCGENCRSPGLTDTWRMRTRLAAQAHIYPTGDGEERAASSPGFYAASRRFARRCARCG